MGDPTYTRENVFQIWRDSNGTRIEVGPDRDGLGLIEIRCYDEKGEIHDRVTMPPVQARLVTEALQEACPL